MKIEDRIRAALRERAEQVRAVPDRWHELAGAPVPPLGPRPASQRWLAATVALAVFAAAVILAWSALRPREGRVPLGASTPTYVIEDVHVEGPSRDPVTEEAAEGAVDVSFRVRWADEVFPGVHACTWTVLGPDGAVVGTATAEVLSTSPLSEPSTVRVPVIGPAETATAACDRERLDVVLSYDVVDAQVLLTPGPSAVVRWTVRWPEQLGGGAWPSPNACTVTVLVDAGETLGTATVVVDAGPTLPTSFETEVPLADAAGLSHAERERLEATVRCEPFTEPVAPAPNAAPTLVGVAEGGSPVEGVRVAVYNGSHEPGLAAAFAAQLQVEGFELAEVGDWPSAIDRTVVYHRGAPAEPVARSVASLVAGAAVEPAPPGLAADPTADVIAVLADPPPSTVFFPTWEAPIRLEAWVSGMLVERDRCLFLDHGDRLVLLLWEPGYSYRDGVLFDLAGDPVVRAGEMLHGGGGYTTDPGWLLDEPVPERCRPKGSEPYAQIYDIAPGLPEG
jgi:hypothetical protein